MKKIVICLFALILFIELGSVVKADERIFENNKNSVVQVVLTYTTNDGKQFILQSGSGVVINSNTVLTNYHLVHMNERNLEKAKKYVLKNSNVTEFTGDEIKVAIVKKDDVLIYGEIKTESKENDFAILSLQEETDFSSVIFGNSDLTIVAENVIAIGYPTTKPFSGEGAQLYTAMDVNLAAGVVSEVDAQNIKLSGKISAGNSGGVLLNLETGEMIGLLVYDKEDEKKECFRSIPVNSLKTPYLEDITYQDNIVVESTQESTEESTELQLDKTLLNDSIQKALKLDSSQYTSDSYLIVVSCLQQAQQIQYNTDVTQEEIDSAQVFLQRSMDNLVVLDQTNWPLIISIIAVVAVCLIIIIILVVMLIKAKKQQKEENQFRTIPSSEIPSFVSEDINQRAHIAATAEKESNGYGQETTLLNTAGNVQKNNSTTILNTAQPQVCAYLIRVKTGEKKLIDSTEYTVGHDATRVSYCIGDNDAISRCHMKIVKRGIRYYLMDLGSANYTFLNEKQIPANQEQEVKHGDHIKAADEEFVLEIM